LAGITSEGFVRKTLQEILSSMKDNIKTKLGSDWNTETGTIEDQFISVFAEEADEVWQGVEGVVSSQTVQGAEGVYLDDVFARQGVYRQGKTKGSGQAVLQSNLQTLVIGTTVSSGLTLSASNGIQYASTDAVTLDNYASCYKIAASQLVIGTSYTFTIYNSLNPSIKSFTRTAINDTDKNAFLQELMVFINEVVIDAPSKAYYEPTGRVLYVGYNQSTNLPNPYPNKRLYVSVLPKVGIIGHSIDIEANTAGYYPLGANKLTGISPTYTGYDSVVNYISLNSGTDVQTDAEFRLSALGIKDNSIAGTPDALKSSLLKLAGVTDVEVFENPSKVYVYDISSQLVCDPYTYNVVVMGGNDLDVAKTIYEKGYGNTKRYGTYTTTITNINGQSVDVLYTRASYFDVGIEVGYTTKDNSPLTEQEKNLITSTLIELFSGLSIGDYVLPKQIEAVVYQSVAFSRLRNLVVKIKDMTLPFPTYTTNNLLANHNEKPRVLVDNITYRRL
jgi:uncharacterized phage protein gp47/JayE